jgi:hypothetical protein
MEGFFDLVMFGGLEEEELLGFMDFGFLLVWNWIILGSRELIDWKSRGRE